MYPLEDVNVNENVASYDLKVLVPIHSLIPPNFFKHMEILVPEVESYLEGCVCEISCANSL